jgi:mRNA interferase MazF
MINYKRGDIVLVPFPFSDQTTVKKRPAVIISSNEYNDNSSDVIIIAVTSQINEVMEIGECLIIDWRKAGLIKLSYIKPAISTIEKALILKNLGKLSDRDIYSMNNALAELLELGAMTKHVLV